MFLPCPVFRIRTTYFLFNVFYTGDDGDDDDFQFDSLCTLFFVTLFSVYDDDGSALMLRYCCCYCFFGYYFALVDGPYLC